VKPIHGDRLSLYIERDLDCDCPWWLRWRIVGYDFRLDRDTVLAHTRTKLGAWWKRRQLERSVLSDDDIVV
jgi:hypothetical protein